MIAFESGGLRIFQGDVLEVLSEMPEASIQCVVTSPPYWGLRDYGVEGQLGLEATPEKYIEKMVGVFREVRRVLRADGTLWMNMGDSYAGSRAGHEGFGTSTLEGNRENQRQANHARKRQGKDCDPKRGAAAEGQPLHHAGFTASRRRDNAEIPRSDYALDGLKSKDLVGMPWMLAFALRADGWYLRQDIIWHKPNPMPESVRDRCTKAHEYIFLLSKSPRYFYNFDAVQEKVTGGSHPRGPGNHSHEGTTAYEEGDERQRTKAGLVAYAEKKRAGVNAKVSGWGQGPGVTHDVLKRAREFGTKGQQMNPEENRAARGAKFGRGAGWRADLQPKQNESFSAAVVDLVSSRNKRSVWTIATEPTPEAHFATFPQDLVRPCILAGCPAGGVVMDPFCGSGTTLLVARDLQCQGIGSELNPEYIEIAARRLYQGVLDFVEPRMIDGEPVQLPPGAVMGSEMIRPFQRGK